MARQKLTTYPFEIGDILLAYEHNRNWSGMVMTIVPNNSYGYVLWDDGQGAEYFLGDILFVVKNQTWIHSGHPIRSEH